MLFIYFFFHFISYCSYYYEFCICVVCDVHEFPRIFSPFVVNDLYFILHLLINAKDYFPFATIVYVIIVIITIILFFSTLPVIGWEFSKWIAAAWSTPTHWLLWVGRRLNIINFSFSFWKFFFGEQRWGVEDLFHFYHMTSFNCEAKKVRDVGLSCRFHLSNGQIVSSV